MGSDHSVDQDSDKENGSQPNNQQSDTPNSITTPKDESTEVLNNMYPEFTDLNKKLDIPTELDNINTKTIEESCPEFAEILNYSNSRVENFRTSFQTKALIGQTLKSTLNFLDNSIKESKADLAKGKEQEDDEESMKYEEKLKKSQQLYERAKSSFEENQSLISSGKADQVYNDLEVAKETLKKKREELEDLKESCDRLFRQYIEMVNSQPV